jgi:hypothetical protein
VFPDILLAEGRMKGDRKGLPLEASVGDVFAVDDPERGGFIIGCGR